MHEHMNTHPHTLTITHTHTHAHTHYLSIGSKIPVSYSLYSQSNTATPVLITNRKMLPTSPVTSSGHWSINRSSNTDARTHPLTHTHTRTRTDRQTDGPCLGVAVVALKRNNKPREFLSLILKDVLLTVSGQRSEVKLNKTVNTRCLTANGSKACIGFYL